MKVLATANRSVALAILASLLLLAVSQLGAQQLVSTAPAPHSIILDGAPLELSLDGGQTALGVQFASTNSGSVTFWVGTTAAPIAAWVTETNAGKTTLLLLEENTPTYSYKTTVQVLAGQRYQVNAAHSVNLPNSAPIRFAISQDSKRSYGIDARVKPTALGLDTPVSFNLSESKDRWRGDPVQLFQFSSPPDGVNGWFKATVRAATVSPFLTTLGKDGKDLGGWRAPYRKEAFASWKASELPVTLVLGVNTLGYASPSPSSATGFVSVEHSPYDPTTPWSGLMVHVLANPIISLIIGAVASLVISYYFFVRSVRRKTIRHKLLSTRPLLQADDATQSHLSVYRNGAPIERSIGLCAVRLDLDSLKDVQKTDVAEPILLTLTNVEQIIRVSARACKGWGSLELPSTKPASVQLSIDHLRPRDWIELDVYYTQTTLSEPALQVTGRIVDGQIEILVDSLPVWRVRFFWAMIVFFALSMLNRYCEQCFNFVSFQYIDSFNVALFALTNVFLGLAALTSRDFHSAVRKFVPAGMLRWRVAASWEIVTLEREPEELDAKGKSSIQAV
jgi:hypothetical protein